MTTIRKDPKRGNILSRVFEPLARLGQHKTESKIRKTQKQIRNVRAYGASKGIESMKGSGGDVSAGAKEHQARVQKAAASASTKVHGRKSGTFR